MANDAIMGFETQNQRMDPSLLNIPLNWLSNIYPEAVGPISAEYFVAEPPMAEHTTQLLGAESVLFDPYIPSVSTTNVHDIEMNLAQNHIYLNHSDFATLNVLYDNTLFHIDTGGNQNHAQSMYLDSTDTGDFL